MTKPFNRDSLSRRLILRRLEWVMRVILLELTQPDIVTHCFFTDSVMNRRPPTIVFAVRIGELGRSGGAVICLDVLQGQTGAVNEGDRNRPEISCDELTLAAWSRVHGMRERRSARKKRMWVRNKPPPDIGKCGFSSFAHDEGATCSESTRLLLC
ncbi:hypothetical protein BV22DRAFT_815108 [Leucogyrophana mollusca]|uniref:Uncharacterized protein n=1 Tax=Leucogyrophana mollusca TaxID=85980 RepID=A0ACB8B3Y8_9AGAM|nr:hypothetical protein BV22DRAFT_815108 [Leucogyrophana mollusca]